MRLPRVVAILLLAVAFAAEFSSCSKNQHLQSGEWLDAAGQLVEPFGPVGKTISAALAALAADQFRRARKQGKRADAAETMCQKAKDQHIETLRQCVTTARVRADDLPLSTAQPIPRPPENGYTPSDVTPRA